MNVSIVFHSDIAYDDLGSRIHIPSVVVVCDSEASAEEHIDRLHAIPVYAKNIYYFTEYEVKGSE